jgi:hypothetical protein
MAYYPLSQITPNLYTNGDEFIYLIDKNPYIGYYYKVSNGRFFAGRTPNAVPGNIEIVRNTLQNNTTQSVLYQEISINVINTSNASADIDLEVIEYNNITNSRYTSDVLLPYYNPQQPTQQDYQNGEFRRFFCKKTNEILYIEINKDQYDKLIAKDPQILWQLYLPFNITWQLTGDEQQVARVNKNMVELAIKNLKLPKFNLYIKEDYTKYYQ